MGGKVRNIARDCRTLHRRSVMAKPVGSEPVLIFEGLVEAIPAGIVSSGAKHWRGQERRMSRQQRQLVRKHGLDSQQMQMKRHSLWRYCRKEAGKPQQALVIEEAIGRVRATL